MISEQISKFKYLKIICQKRGAGLTELMAAVAVMGIVLMGAASLNSTFSSSTMDARARMSYSNLSAMIRGQLMYGDTCMSSLGPIGGGNILVGGVAGIADKEITAVIPNLMAGAAMNSSVLAAGQILPLQGLMVSSFSIRNINPTGNTIGVPAGSTEYIAQIYVRAEKITTSQGGKNLREHLVTGIVIVSEDATGTMQSCNTGVSTSESKACNLIGCNYKPANPVGKRCVCPNYPMGCPAYTYPIGIVGGNFICSEIGAAGAACPKINSTTGAVDAVNGVQTYAFGMGLADATSPACLSPMVNGQSMCFGVNYCSEGLTGDGAPAIPSTPDCTGARAVLAGAAWKVGLNTCNADTTTTILNGATAAVTDTAGTTQGTATFICSNGLAAVAASPPPTCNVGCTVAATQTWTVGANICTVGASFVGNVIASGATLPVTATIAANGSATLSCTSSALSILAGATCTAPTGCLGTLVGNKLVDLNDAFANTLTKDCWSAPNRPSTATGFFAQALENATLVPGESCRHAISGGSQCVNNGATTDPCYAIFTCGAPPPPPPCTPTVFSWGSFGSAPSLAQIATETPSACATCNAASCAYSTWDGGANHMIFTCGCP